MTHATPNVILAELFRHNLWANLALIDRCASLPDDVLETNVPGAFGSIRETLGHLGGPKRDSLSVSSATASAMQLPAQRQVPPLPRCGSVRWPQATFLPWRQCASMS